VAVYTSTVTRSGWRGKESSRTATQCDAESQQQKPQARLQLEFFAKLVFGRKGGNRIAYREFTGLK
jgi:hypothetical protein